MSQYALENFGGYRKAMELFDLVVADMGELRGDPRCYRLVAQQVASADSVCANVEEGYGRLSRAEYVRFLDFARGSARETRGRYLRMKHWLSPEVVQHRVGLADEIVAILTKTMETLRRELRASPSQTACLHEEPTPYSANAGEIPSTLDPPPSPHV
jgi:four helix bundle protein